MSQSEIPDDNVICLDHVRLMRIAKQKQDKAIRDGDTGTAIAMAFVLDDPGPRRPNGKPYRVTR